MARRGPAPWNRRILPSGLPGWLQSLPDAEPAIYGDPKAPVKENGGSASGLSPPGGPAPPSVPHPVPVFLDLLPPGAVPCRPGDGARGQEEEGSPQEGLKRRPEAIAPRRY